MKNFSKYRKRAGYALVVLASACVAAGTVSCSGKGDKAEYSEHLTEAVLPDTLIVATLYSPSSYFIYRDEPMGYDYDIISRFAEEKGLALKIEVAPSVHRAIEMLDSGKVDLIAYEIPEITEYKDRLTPCGPRSETHQVLVQPRKEGRAQITDVTDLPGLEVAVEEGTKYYYRLQNLDEELGGGIKIDAIDSDTIDTEALIEMVAEGEVPLTIVDNDIAQINATYFPTLDISVDVSFPQASAWAVSTKNAWLGDSIDVWLDTDKSREADAELHKRYFEQERAPQVAMSLDLSDGTISKYDHLFRKYAPEINWDWRLLASQSFQESKFNPKARSWAGARGLMQIMPRTARAYQLAANKMNDPESSIATSVKLLDDLDKMLMKKVPDDRERLKFILAAYNGGIGHVTDAMNLAEKYGLDPTKWDGNVEKAVLMKSNPEYYNDPVVKYGYMRGRETAGYVERIMKYYERFKREIPA
ncbi:MAG: transglycosylase SLT domain-containing protein [Barnesiella sp.]|nr:transglycosylase SLT domain-containing protein [Barnesiella sp.]MBD5247743.1 transglycosylase SLT domain-containing protein [Barnesiella sp.]